MDWADRLVQAHKLPADYAEIALDGALPLVKRVMRVREISGRPVIVGINGAQGAGKTTFALFLAHWLEWEMELTTVCLSLDDMYLRKSEREKHAQEVHPLFRTRGVPGTHDVRLAQRTLDALTNPDQKETIALPAFDKGRDDRAPEESWPLVDAPVDVVLFEGWCVGARPQPAPSLFVPVNKLEVEEDRGGIWRREVNERLRTDYAELFRRIDLLIMLRVPSFEKVFEWRALQERKLREDLLEESSRSPTRLGQTPGELARFIQHYERLTRHMLETMPDYSDAVIDMDDEHRMTSLVWPKRPA